MQLGIYEILKRAADAQKVDERARLLQKYDNPTLRKILKYTYSEKVTFLGLPEGAPPFKKNDLPDSESILYAETRRLYLFTDGGNPDLKQLRKEVLFVELLEALHPKDAEIVVGMKDKKLPDDYKRITKAVVEKAFPELL